MVARSRMRRASRGTNLRKPKSINVLGDFAKTWGKFIGNKKGE